MAKSNTIGVINVGLIAMWVMVGAYAVPAPEFDEEPDPAVTAVIEMPYCQMEDGSDVDGYCLWVDPGTGHGYINPTPEEVRH